MSATELEEDDVVVALEEFISRVDGEPRLKVSVDGRRHTVDIRPVYEFERNIVDDVIDMSTTSSMSGAAIPVKGRWIHGWLTLNDEDYINSIWKNYQFFLTYLEAYTEGFNNLSTYSRSPGTYDSMYRYLMILEDLELLERHRRQPMPQEAYDFPVPEEFRTRTFIRLLENYEDNRDQWNNPYGAAYPEGEKPEEPDEEPDEEPEAPEQPVEPEPEPEPEEEPDEVTTGLGAFVPEGEEPGDEELEEDVDELPEEGASLEDFQDIEGLISLVNESIPEALERTFTEAPIPIQNTEPEDFSLDRIAGYGDWVTGNAVPGQTPLELIVSIDGSQAALSPPFVLSGIEEHLSDVMRENNRYPDIFPRYFVISVYSGAFKSKVDEVVAGEQEELIYYNFQDQEIQEL